MKRIIALILALSTIVCGVFVFTACDNAPEGCTSHIDSDKNELCDNCGEKMTADPKPDPNPNAPTAHDYTVTVLDHEGAPIEGLSVKFLYEDKESDVYTTDASGKATASLPTEREVQVSFVDLKDYGAPSKKKATFESLEYELEITLNPLITVKVVDENGAPVKGVSVQICHDVCLLPADTDENGIMSKAFAPKDKLKVAIAAVPDGYAKPEVIYEIAGTEYHAEFAEGDYTITVTIPFAE